MVIHRGFRYRLYPSPEQAALLGQTASATRFVYNLALEQRRDFWRQAKAQGIALNFISQGREITQVRAEHDWLGAVAATPLIQALRQLDDAFRAFFTRRAGYPTFRNKGDRPRFRHKGTEVRLTEVSRRWAMIRVPKIGLVRLRLTRPWRGRIVSANFSRDALGWHVSLGCEIEHEAPANSLPGIGIDRGIANTLALSNGEIVSTPAMVKLTRRKKAAQRVLARRRSGSARYRAQRQRVARIAAKIARARADWRHRATTDIARRFGLVSIEALHTSDMTRSGRGKRGLNRSILEQGWGAIEAALAYKLEERGGTLVKVDPRFTSQTCSDCGTIDKASRESQASFACRSCGFTIHADTNAALNILRRSTASMRVEDGGCPADESRTANHVALAA